MTVSYLDREDRKIKEEENSKKEPKEEQGRTDLRNVMERRGGERKMRGTERDRELSVPSNLNIFRSVTEEVHGFHFQLVR